MSQYQDLMTAADKARLSYSDQIKQNPAAFGQFATDNAKVLLDQTMAQKENGFLQARMDLARALDQTHNVKLYQTRTADTDNLAQQIERNNQTVQGQLDDDKAMTKRQFEINQWYNYKKENTIGLLENSAWTLGMIAVGFVALRVGGSLGYVAPGLVTLGSSLIGLGTFYLVVSTWWRFSTMTSDKSLDGKDPILWHRKRFGPSNIDPIKLKCDPDTGELVKEAEEANSCLNEAAMKLAELGKATEKDLESYLEGTTGPRSLCAPRESFVSTSV
jgi:hypothetical protein